VENWLISHGGLWGVIVVVQALVIRALAKRVEELQEARIAEALERINDQRLNTTQMLELNAEHRATIERLSNRSTTTSP